MKYPIKFKAAILEEIKKPLAIREIFFEGPLKKGQVLVKIHYSGICGKQIEEIQGISNFQGKPDPYIPHMLGHEGGGEVLDIGPGVKKVKEKDYVVLHWRKGSGIDSETPFYYNDKGERINAGWITTFNEYGVISENRLTPISRAKNLEVACLLGCCVTTGLGVVLNEAKPSEKDSVAVFGCGGVGLNIIQGAKLIRAKQIIAIDINSKALEFAEIFGATNFIDATKYVASTQIKKITQEEGANFVFSAVGYPQVIEEAVKSSSMPGEVYFVGVPPLDSEIKINAFAIHNLRTLKGSHGGNTFPDRDIPKYLKLYEEGLLKFDELISDKVSLEKVNEGIQKMKYHIGRQIIDMR